MTTPLIEFDHVSKTYQSGGGPVNALSDVTLEIAGGFGLPRDIDRSFERLVDMLHEGNRVAAEAVRLRS